MENRLGRTWTIVLILVLSMFAPLSTDMYLSGLPQMILDFNTNETIMSMSLYLFMLALAISMLILGPLSDKYGRRKLLLISLSIYIIASILCCIVPNVWLFIFFRIVQAIGGGGAMTGVFALIKDLFEGNDMKFVLSLIAALGIIGPIVAPILGTVLINAISWHATFWAPAAIAIVCLAMVILLPSEIPIERYSGTVKESVSNVFCVMKDRDFSLFMIMMCVFSGSQLAYIAVSSYIYQGEFGLSTTEYSLALAAACIGGLILSFLLQRMKFLTNIQTITLMFVLGIISLIMMTFFAKCGWVWFLLAMVPCCAITITARSFGFVFLMNDHDGDNGSVSAAINFTTFMFATFGMVVASVFPSDMFIYGIAAVMLFSCVTYAVSWYLLKKNGYGVKGLVDN